MAAITTGIPAVVATMAGGTMGRDPSTVKHTKASKARRIENCVKNRIFFLLLSGIFTLLSDMRSSPLAFSIELRIGAGVKRAPACKIALESSDLQNHSIWLQISAFRAYPQEAAAI
jgi:NhaP-type Na+/H+ or K+/H+ antiporter